MGTLETDVASLKEKINTAASNISELWVQINNLKETTNSEIRYIKDVTTKQYREYIEKNFKKLEISFHNEIKHSMNNLRSEMNEKMLEQSMQIKEEIANEKSALRKEFQDALQKKTGWIDRTVEYLFKVGVVAMIGYLIANPKSASAMVLLL